MVSGLGDAKGREEKEDSVCAILGISYWKISEIVRWDGWQGREGENSCADPDTHAFVTER